MYVSSLKNVLKPTTLNVSQATLFKNNIIVYHLKIQCITRK